MQQKTHLLRPGLILAFILGMVLGTFYQSLRAMFATGPSAITTETVFVPWKDYASPALGLSFSYPSNWVVSEWTGYSDHVPWPALDICPLLPEKPSFLGGTDKSGNHCITFYSKGHLDHPFVGMEDE